MCPSLPSERQIDAAERVTSRRPNTTPGIVNIPHLRLLDSDGENGDEQAAHPLGIRTLRQSGGSVVVTIPPEVVELVDMNLGGDVVVHATSDSIVLTKLDREE